MARPVRKKVDFTSESLKDLLQNIWSEADEQRNKAVNQYIKQNRDVKDNEDIALVSKINADYLKIVNDSIEKKLSVAKLVKDVVYKDSVNQGSGDSAAPTEASVSDNDKESIYDLIQKATEKENIELVLDREKQELQAIDDDELFDDDEDDEDLFEKENDISEEPF